MEPVGLAVGVVGLAGLFNNAVDCFEYVQLGRNFGTNFQTSLLKLDHARIRLSRWGEAVGLSGDLKDTQSLQAVAVKQEDKSKAEAVLGQILKLFKDAEKSSANYKSSKSADDPDVAALEVRAHMDSTGQSLHEKMRKLCIKRQNKSTLSQKAKWAFYEEEHFNKLIEDIQKLVDALTDIFPATRQEQRQLCDAEVSEIGVESLPVLDDVVKVQDKDLEAAISAAIRAAVSKSSLRQIISRINSKQGATFHNHNSKIGAQGSNVTINGGMSF